MDGATNKAISINTDGGNYSPNLMRYAYKYRKVTN